MANILNQSQAEAIYSAMCTLKNVNGRLNCQFDDSFNKVNIYENEFGDIWIWIYGPNKTAEYYESQADFATTYGLQQG